MKDETTKLLLKIIEKINRIEAQINQLGPVRVETTLQQEADAVIAQGGNLTEYFKNKEW